MFGHWEILIVLVVILLFFGVGRIPKIMGDLGKGISSFKKGMADKPDDKETITAPKKSVKKSPTKKKPSVKKAKK